MIAPFEVWVLVGSFLIGSGALTNPEFNSRAQCENVREAIEVGIARGTIRVVGMRINVCMKEGN